MNMRASDRRRATELRDNGLSGVVVTNAAGNEQLVMSDQQLYDDIVATIPKLHSAVRRDTKGPCWKQTASKENVHKFELVSSAAGTGSNDDVDIVHAIVAKTELKCHINEVLNVLVHQDSTSYDATMKALSGNKFAQGDVLFQQRCSLVPERSQSSRHSLSSASSDSAQSGLIAVKLATIKPKFGLHFSRKHKRTQKLCLATFAHKYASQDRAVHVIKTLPKAVHDQIVAEADRSALRGDLDHLAVGFDIQFFPTPGGGSSSHTTRIFAHGYASTVPPSKFGSHARQSHRSASNASDGAKRRAAVMNSEATHVLRLLTDSLAQFERVIRRRRFGFQSFIYFPKGYDDDATLVKRCCAICAKHFAFYRRDFFCQLCGHMACSDCSQLHDVEARAGDVRQNRVCLPCVVRVDACVFDDEDLLQALGPVIVDVDDREWLADDLFHLDGNDYNTTDDTLSDSDSDGHGDDTDDDGSNLNALTAPLDSTDAALQSLALDQLDRLVSPSATRTRTLEASAGRTDHQRTNAQLSNPVQDVRLRVENYVSQRLQARQSQYKDSSRLAVADRAHDYQYAFDATQTVNTHHPLPLPPAPARVKEARRLELIDASGVLAADYDSSALDVIAQVAATRLGCPIGFVSVVDAEQFHAVGTFQLPEEAVTCARTENMCIHAVYAEQPLVVKNPQRDMRFAQLSTVRDLDVKFYAGFPVRAPDGAVIASLCAADAMPHNHLTTKEYATMETLAELASKLLVSERQG